MNQLANQENTATVLFNTTEAREAFTLANLVFNPSAMQALHTTATGLANSGMVPDHFKGKPDDVMAAMMQAGRWGLDPLYVMQSTFVLQGKVGYEAKILQSVAQSMGGVEFDVEYYGAWEKIQGNFTVETGRNNSKYNKPAWKRSDENGVGVRLTGIFPNGKERTIDVALTTCHPRNSTNWANDPETQIHYTAIKRWVRRHAPHLLGGIQDYDDLKARQDNAEREINPMPMKDEKPAEAKSKVIEDVDDILNYDDQAQEKTTVETQPTAESVEDILNYEPQQQTQSQDVPTKPDNVDEDGVYNPTVYEQMVDLLNDCQTPEDYQQAKKACIESFNTGQVVGEDAENLGKLMRSLAKALEIGA